MPRLSESRKQRELRRAVAVLLREASLCPLGPLFEPPKESWERVQRALEALRDA